MLVAVEGESQDLTGTPVSVSVTSNLQEARKNGKRWQSEAKQQSK